MPFFGVYLSVTRGVPLSLVGVSYLFAALLGFGSQLIGGRLVDSFGPKKVMYLGYVISTITSTITAYLVIVNTNVLILLILYPCFNFSRGFSQPAIGTIVSGRKGNQLRTGFALQYIGGNLGFAIGPAVGGFLAQYVGYGSIFLLGSATSLVTLGSAMFWFRKERPDENLQAAKSDRRIKYRLSWNKDSGIILLLALMFCSFLALGYEITPMSLYAASFLHIPTSEIGLLFTTNGALIVVAQLPMTRFYSKFRSMVFPLIISCVLMASAYLIVAFSTVFLELELAMIVVTMGEVSLTVPAQIAITGFSKPGNRGTFQGYYSAFSNGGRSIASFIGPSTFQLFASQVKVAWYAIGSFALLTGVLLAWSSPRVQHDYDKTQESRQDASTVE